VATDINQGPLQKAQQTVNAYRVGHAVDLIQCDGLSGVDTGTVDCVVIAGMGGELIADILEAWLGQNTSKKPMLLLQPMSRTPLLREFLAKNGFFTEEERFVQSGRRVYSILKAQYGDTNRKISEVEIQTGPMKEAMGQVQRLYIQKRLASLKREQNGLDGEGQKKQSMLIAQIEDILRSGEL